MDKRAAEQYLDKIFGTRQGHVAVAYKDKGQSWQECQFAWPADRNKLLGWAEVHADANIFINPALRRDAHTRKKGDMQPTPWLWADVDFQAVPADKLEDVHARIKELGTYIVSSGTGDNAHVYVELDKPVEHEDFIKLNTGLRDYLYGDNKQADNSLLRLPGTTNWKTDTGSPVAVRGGNGKKVTKPSLLKRRQFRDAKVPTDAVSQDWTFVEVDGLSRRMVRKVQMPVEEALGRYGARNKAVWAITKDLHKAGLGPDEVHSLMDKFPAALDKMAEENGYDVHSDVARCLARIAQTEAEIESIEQTGDEEMSEVSDEDHRAELVNEGVERELIRREVRRAADALEALQGHTEPPDDASESLDDALSAPPEPVQYLIDGLCSATGTVVITGQYKSGKTHLMISSLIRSLADNEPFLGVKQIWVPDEGAVVGHWNLEMSRLDLVDKYARPAGFKNPHNVKLAHWQGYRLNILSALGKAAAVEWLKTRSVKVWTIDSWSALCRMAGVDPNDNKEVGDLLGAVTEIKVEAGVQAVFLLAHTARSSGDSDKPGTRGASALDETVDTRWMFTVDKNDIRFLQAEGRGTQMPSTSLDFNEETGRSTLGTSSRQSIAAEGWVQEILRIVNMQGDKGITESALWTKMKEIRGIAKPKAVEYMIEAEESGMIRREKGRPVGQHGGREAWIHYPAVKVEGKGMNATPADVDMRDVRVRKKRRPTEE